MFVNFSLRSIEAEASDKVASMIYLPEKPVQDLLNLCGVLLDKSGMAEVVKSLVFARSLSSTDPHHPSMQAYLSHPLRVAKLSLQLLAKPSAATVSLGLLHNVFEVSGISEEDLLKAGYSEHLARGIRVLTIDRQQQYDPAYLATFYRDIENYGEELVLIKCVDRIDNLLAFQLFERTERINLYLELSDRFVTPMATRLSPELGYYHAKLIQHMISIGCDQSLKKQYDAFLADYS